MMHVLSQAAAPLLLERFGAAAAFAVLPLARPWPLPFATGAAPGGDRDGDDLKSSCNRSVNMKHAEAAVYDACQLKGITNISEGHATAQHCI